MDVRGALITVNKDDFVRAVTAHMSAILLGQVTTDDMFEAPSAAIIVYIDGDEHVFSIRRTVTDYSALSGMILSRPIIADSPDEPNTLEYVLLKVFNGDFEEVQKVYSLGEDVAVDNAGRTAMDLLAKLYLE